MITLPNDLPFNKGSIHLSYAMSPYHLRSLSSYRDSPTNNTPAHNARQTPSNTVEHTCQPLAISVSVISSPGEDFVLRFGFNVRFHL